MGTLKTFVEQKGITEKHLLVASNRVEHGGNDARALLNARSKKRRIKETADKKYAELNLGKPVSNRGLSSQQVAAALADKPVSKRVRSKVLRAVNAVLTAKYEAAFEMKAIFEGTAGREGKKPKETKPGEAKK